MPLQFFYRIKLIKLFPQQSETEMTGRKQGTPTLKPELNKHLGANGSRARRKRQWRPREKTAAQILESRKFVARALLKKAYPWSQEQLASFHAVLAL
jgi:hypothetical protein